MPSVRPTHIRRRLRRGASLLLSLLLFCGAWLTACDTGNDPAHTGGRTDPVTQAEPLPETLPETHTEALTDTELLPAPTVPAVLQSLLDRELITADEITGSAVGGTSFHLLSVSVSDLLARGGVTHLTDGTGTSVSTDAYGDWYLYTVGETCSLYYMRAAGVGISFVPLSAETLLGCLEGTDDGVSVLFTELDGVTRSSADGQHSTELTVYFSNPATDGAYRIAEAYLQRVASTAEDGVIPVPAHYDTCDPADGEYIRVLEAVRYLESLHPGLILWSEDRPAGIRVSDSSALADHEKQAIQAFYTMNVTLCSFAAEVAVHAAGCDNWLILKYYGYDRCKIADMAVGAYNATAGMVARWENEFGFYNLDSMAVKAQEAHHPNHAGEYLPTVPAS